MVTVSKPSLPPSPHVTTATGIVAIQRISNTGADRSEHGRDDRKMVVSFIFDIHFSGRCPLLPRLPPPLELPARDEFERMVLADPPMLDIMLPPPPKPPPSMPCCCCCSNASLSACARSLFFLYVTHAFAVINVSIALVLLFAGAMSVIMMLPSTPPVFFKEKKGKKRIKTGRGVGSGVGVGVGGRAREIREQTGRKGEREKGRKGEIKKRKKRRTGFESAPKKKKKR